MDEDFIKGKTGTIPFTLKHIDDLQIGDEIVFTIPMISDMVSKVCFINKEHKFIFLEGCCSEFDEEYPDEQRGLQFIPDKDGNYQLYDREKHLQILQRPKEKVVPTDFVAANFPVEKLTDEQIERLNEQFQDGKQLERSSDWDWSDLISTIEAHLKK